MAQDLRPARRAPPDMFWFGLAIGVAVAVGAAAAQAWIGGLPAHPMSLIEVHAQSPALWVVDMLPVLLGGLGWLAARSAPATVPVDARTRALEAQLAKALAERGQALADSRSKSEFLAGMSHELRTPLNAIIGYSEMLREEVEEGNPLSLEDLNKVVTAAQHLLELINNVLDLSKIEAGRMSTVLEPVPVNEVLAEVERTVTPLAQRGKNGFEIHHDPLLTHVRGDRMRIRQVLINLLSNAFKFTRGGKVMLRAEVEERDGLRWACLRVQDDGIGMDGDQVGRLFGAYTQVSHREVRQGGTGLGLAISQRLAEMMAGRIEVHSEEGVGSTFTLVLPAPDVEEVLTLAPPAAVGERPTPSA